MLNSFLSSEIFSLFFILKYSSGEKPFKSFAFLFKDLKVDNMSCLGEGA